MSQNFEGIVGRRSRDEEHESRSGSNNMDDGSGDGQDAADNPPTKKRHHRHTHLSKSKNLKLSPHPDVKQKLELSRRINLETKQVEFWFTNHRTQMRTQLERHENSLLSQENSLLRQENDKLRAEIMSIRDAMRNPTAIVGDISLEEQDVRIEIAHLKDELDRVSALAGKFLGRPISSQAGSVPSTLPNSSLELAVGNNGFGGLTNART